MSKALIGVVTCHAFREKADAQRKTWVPEATCDVRFFIGGGQAQRDDEVVLDVPDDYEGLPAKVKAMCAWALANGYDMLFRVDDDVYVRPDRLIEAMPEGIDYCGRVRGASDMMHPWPYCSGFSYWLSDFAMRAIVSSALTDVAEDRLTGQVMMQAGIEPIHDDRYVIVNAQRSSSCSDVGPLRSNGIISSCESDASSIFKAHEAYLSSSEKPKPKPRPFDNDFSRIDILIKTFIRDGFLRRTVKAIEQNMPAARMVIIDDGMNAHFKPYLYARLREEGHAVHQMNFDSGFGAKSNAAMRFYKNEYVLIASDDFDFSKLETCEAIRKMVRVLDHDKSIGIVSGRVNNSPYEFKLQMSGTECREVPIDYASPMQAGDATYHLCDLTVNYSLIRRELLAPTKLHWYSDIKIGGGEHGAFFILAKKLGIGVAYVEDVSISEQAFFVGCQDSRYPGMRARARGEGRPALLREGITKYYCAGSATPEIC